MSEARNAQMLATMARMQEEHNLQVHPQWREQGYRYYRAIWVECAEMLDHFGWKWWKHQQPDLEQVKLELVDIWHFGLSEMIRADELSDDVAHQLAAASGEAGEEALREAIERLALSALSTQGFDAEPFAAAMAALPMGYDELYRLYVGKNVLNRFRQDHGYKSGEYLKVWAGREDNEHLVEVLADLDLVSADAPETLYAALAARYPGSSAS